MNLVEKLNIIIGELGKLNSKLRFLSNCNVSNITFGIRLGILTQQLKDLSDNYIKSINEFEVDKNISMSIYNNIQAAIKKIEDNSGNKLTYYCFCIGKAHNCIATAINELDDWITTMEIQ